MKNLSKKISWLVLGVMMLAMATAYICPMAVNADTMVAVPSTGSCHSTVVSVSANMAGMSGCLGAHLTTIGQFLGDISQAGNLLLALILLTVVYRFFSGNFLTALIRPLFSRLRHRYLYYQASIKLLVAKKLLRYLQFIGNYTIVSLA